MNLLKRNKENEFNREEFEKREITEIENIINNEVEKVCGTKGKDKQGRIDEILNEYKKLCIEYKENYVNGELDTFKKAGCLLISINNSGLVSDKKLNAEIALSSALKMCENPYYNVGPNYDIPIRIQSIDFEKAFGYDYERLTEGFYPFLIDKENQYDDYNSCSDLLYLEYYIALLKANKEPMRNDEIINEGMKKYTR